MIKLIHTADLHLDSPLASAKNYPISKQTLRDIFNNIVELAKQNSVDALLISGDLFDNESVSIITRDIIISIIKSAPKILFFIIAGNHDCLKESSIYNTNKFPENVKIFRGTRENSIERFDIDELNLSVYGLSLYSEDSEQRLLRDFKVADNTRINIMLFHGNLVTSNTKSNYFPLSTDEIANTGLDYLALGHIHSFSGVKKVNNTYYAYSGIPQGRGFDEISDKGIIMGNIDKNFCDLSFVKTSKINFEILELDISECDNIYQVADIIKDQIINSNFSYRIILIGSISKNLYLDINALKNIIDREFIDIIDKTTIFEDVSALSKENNLKGIFIKNILQNNQISDDIKKEAIKIGLAAMSGGAN